MPDQRKHRGPHPGDERLFSPEQLPGLREASHDLSWLLSRGYALPSSLKLTGDRYALASRQRIAVSRAACSDQQRLRRTEHRLGPLALASETIWIDGYNVLTSIEAALSGGVILKCVDGSYRDMASMHGSYRKVTETLPAIVLIGEHLQGLNLTRSCWFLDQPVSNSGRLREMLLDVAKKFGWDWNVDLVPDPDPILATAPCCVASADSEILDRADRCYALAKEIISRKVSEAWVIDLS